MNDRAHGHGDRGPADLSDLEVEVEVGRGAHSTVDRVRRGDLRYALKRPRVAGTDDDREVLAALGREAAMLACVDHPGVVRTHAVGRYAGRPALVTEFIDGGSLADALINGALPPDRVLVLAVQLAEALAAAHRIGLVHRDIKPRNILVPPGRPAVLIDFGLAVLGRSPALEESAVGTFVYAAPEQSGMLKRPVDGRSDLYSLGAVLFECLVGDPPFAAPDLGELLRLHTVAPVPDIRKLRPEADPRLVEIITRLLAKDPDDRYASAPELLADLLRLVPGVDPAAAAPVDWPLCGRDAERDALLRRWTGARQGRGGAAAIGGPAGGGRTRLAAEAAAAATADGALVLRAPGVRDEVLPLAAIRTALERHLTEVRALPRARRDVAHERLRRAPSAAGAGLLRNLSPNLASLLAEVPAPSNDGRDDRLFAAVAVFLAGLAEEHGGAVLVLDDAQWLDPATRRVLALLAPVLSSTPLLVVVTEPDDTASPIVDDLGTALDTDVIAGALSEADTAALVASRLPGARTTPELVAHLAARTGGLPQACVEYLFQLVDAGLLVPVWGTWRLDESGLESLPSGTDVRQLIVSRLAGLPDEVHEVLAAAAAVGSRFRLDLVTAASGLAAERVVAALAAAVSRRLVETREGGRYGFVHAGVRDALLADVPAGRLRDLHLAIAAVLDELPPALREPGHVYAVARHYVLAGADAEPVAVYRSTLAAGRQALADQAPTEAVDFLEQTVAASLAAGRSPGTEALHPLAIAYLGVGLFAEAQATLAEALSRETDRDRRAELRTTLIELHHTTWSDGPAVRAAAEALAELGHALPRGKLRLIGSTLGLFFLGSLVRLLRIGFGTARGRRREELTALARVLDAGAYAAGIGMRNKEMVVFAMRAAYPANRIGPGPEYVRVHAMLSHSFALLKRRRPAERHYILARQAATDLADPALVAYVDWLRGCGLLFGGFDDGRTWEEAIATNARWLSPGQYIAGLATFGIRQVVRGYTSQAQATYDRGLTHLPHPEQAAGTSFAMLSVMVPAQQGRPAEAAAALAALRSSIPLGTGTQVQEGHLLTAALYAAAEQGEYGAPFEEIVDAFDRLGLARSDLMVQLRWFYVYRAHGRMAQLRLSPPEERPARSAIAREAVHELGRVATTPLLKVAHGIGEAALFQQHGRPDRAIQQADRMERAARPHDAPLVIFEICRIRARALRDLGLVPEAERQARYAHMLATTHGWEHRRRQVRVEFGVDEAPTSSRFSPALERGVRATRNRRLEALQQVSAAASTVLDPQQLARVALDETLRILGAERALLFLLDSAGELVSFAGRDAAGADLDTATGYGSTLVRKVLQTGEPLVVTGTDEGAALGSQSVVLHGLRSIMVSPVKLKGQLKGVVYLDSRMARGIFTSDDVEVLNAITSHVAVSLETARAAQLDLAVSTARRQQELAETLSASLAELTAILEPPQVLHTLFATLHRQLAADAGCLLQGAGTELTVVARTGAADRALVGRQLDATDPATAVLCTATVPSVVSADACPPALRALLGERAALVVPLVAREGRVGVVLLAAASFDDTGREVASALASQGMSAYGNALLFSRVQELATTDDLTGVHNRRHFCTLAAVLVDAARRGDRDLAAVMLDIDDFKSINDSYGHAVGDDVIQEVARRLGASVRGSDVLGRYGGEEFAVVLPDLAGQGLELAERMRAAVAATPVATRGGPIPVTVSVGFARLDAEDDGLDPLVARADHALYRAKGAGRNRVVADLDGS